MSTKKCVGCGKTLPKSKFEGKNSKGIFQRKMCSTCLITQRNKNRSKTPEAYLRHLFAANEFLGKQIASIHNLGFYLWLVREARKQILGGNFTKWKNKMVRQMNNRL